MDNDATASDTSMATCCDHFLDINSLPNEILEYILSLTSPYCDLKSASLVCKRWYNITKDVIQYYQNQFYKAVTGFGNAKLLWYHHQPEAGPTVTERFSHSACYCNKSIYVFGGCTSTSTTFNDLWQFDLQLGRWVRPLATGTYPSPKACASLVEYRGVLVLFGGWSHPTPYTFHQASRFFNQLHTFSPGCNRWSQIVTVDSPEGIAGHGATIVGDRMIVFGGYHGHGNSSNMVWTLDLLQMVWTKQTTADPKPLPRYSHTQVLLSDHHILVVGGCGGPNMQFNDVWLLDMSCTPWRWIELTVENQDFAAQQLWCHPGCKINDKLVVLGKYNGKLPAKVTTASVPKQSKHKFGDRIRQPKASPSSTAGCAVAANDHDATCSPETLVNRRLQPSPGNQPSDSDCQMFDLQTNAQSQPNSLSTEMSPGLNAPTSSTSSVYHAPAAAADAVQMLPGRIHNFAQADEGQGQHTLGVRAGMPSVRPNAMNDRRRRLEALSKHEDMLRAAAARQSNSAFGSRPRRSLTSSHRPQSLGPGMSVYVLDLSNALLQSRVSWLLVQNANDVPGAPDEAIFYSLVQGRGELMMFGGIRGDVRSIQRNSPDLPQHTVSKDVHFLTFAATTIY